MNEIINDLLNGQTPFARARRHRTGRAWTGQAGAGCTRSGQDGTESAGAGRAWTGLYPNTEQRKAERRNPSIYMGQWINVKRRADGTVYPTFKRTKGIGAGKLGDYAVNTTCELLMVVGKHEAAMALAEVEGFDLSELFASDGGLGEEKFGEMRGFAAGRGLGEEEDFEEE